MKPSMGSRLMQETTPWSRGCTLVTQTSAIADPLTTKSSNSILILRRFSAIYIAEAISCLCLRSFNDGSTNFNDAVTPLSGRGKARSIDVTLKWLGTNRGWPLQDNTAAYSSSAQSLKGNFNDGSTPSNNLVQVRSGPAEAGSIDDRVKSLGPKSRLVPLRAALQCRTRADEGLTRNDLRSDNITGE